MMIYYLLCLLKDFSKPIRGVKKMKRDLRRIFISIVAVSFLVSAGGCDVDPASLVASLEGPRAERASRLLAKVTGIRTGRHHGEPITAHQTVYHDGDHPSRLLLPVIP